jgi:gamma-glutamylcyclotransferase (GGCT)/AIG2-like uncharacterized protein YtfP
VAFTVADFLFVYGTLRPGLWPSQLRPLLTGLRCLGPATVRGRLYDLGAHPAARLDAEGDERVRGEVLELPPGTDALTALDKYEDFYPADLVGSLFLRLLCDAELADGRTLVCWIYAYNRDPGLAPLVPDGDYVHWRTGRNPS